MNEEAAKKIANGLSWLGFWLFAGMFMVAGSLRDAVKIEVVSFPVEVSEEDVRAPRSQTQTLNFEVERYEF